MAKSAVNCHQEEEPNRSDGVFNANENYEWISIAALLMVLQPYRARCTLSQDDSMAGFGLPQAGQRQGLSLLISSVRVDPRRSE
jgi:hypothetical protein